MHAVREERRVLRVGATGQVREHRDRFVVGRGQIARLGGALHRGQLAQHIAHMLNLPLALIGLLVVAAVAALLPAVRTVRMRILDAICGA